MLKLLSEKKEAKRVMSQKDVLEKCFWKEKGKVNVLAATGRGFEKAQKREARNRLNQEQKGKKSLTKRGSSVTVG